MVFDNIGVDKLVYISSTRFNYNATIKPQLPKSI